MQKEILVGGRIVKLFSFDNHTWVSRPSDLKRFQQRRAVEIRVIRRMVADHVPDGSQALGRVDFW